MAKANKDGWIRHSGGKCPVDKGVRIDVRFRSGDVMEDTDCVWSWHHHGGRSDIMAYRIRPTEQKEPQPMTSEQIRTKYIENLASIADLHKQNAALVDDLHKLGFDFYDAPKEQKEQKEQKEDMSDPKNWRAGDELICLSDYEGQFTEGKVYIFREIDRIGYVGVVNDDNGYTKNGWGVENFKFHSRPTA